MLCTQYYRKRYQNNPLIVANQLRLWLYGCDRMYIKLPESPRLSMAMDLIHDLWIEFEYCRLHVTSFLITLFTANSPQKCPMEFAYSRSSNEFHEHRLRFAVNELIKIKRQNEIESSWMFIDLVVGHLISVYIKWPFGIKNKYNNFILLTWCLTRLVINFIINKRLTVKW